jgi:hypothetical protein
MTFIRENHDLGHMEPDPVEEFQKRPHRSCCLPYHVAIKGSSSPRKTHVLLEANSKTTCGVSLNDKLWVRPRLQAITLLLISFRQHAIPLKADVSVMNLEVKVPRKELIVRNHVG